MDEIMNSHSDSQEVFQRVWARVMGSSPTAQNMPVDISTPETTLAPPPVANVESVSTPTPLDHVICAPTPNDQLVTPMLPPPEAAPPQAPTCCLRQQVMDSLEQWQIARLLIRRAGNQSQQMRNLTAQLHQQAKQLSAAYFLQSGVQYWPVAQLTQPRLSSFMGGLRTLYQRGDALQDQFHRCRAQEKKSDLAQLYTQLIQGCAQRAIQLRTLLEKTQL